MIIFAPCSTLHAAPAAPDPVDLIQPDGTYIKTVLRGDEFQNWREAEATGHTIIRSSKSGYWEYAELAKDGTLRPSGIRVLPGGMNPPGTIGKGIRPPRNKEHEQQMQQMIQDAYQQRSTANSSTTSPAQPASSTSCRQRLGPGTRLGNKKTAADPGKFCR